MNNSIQNILDPLWSSKIVKFEINLDKHEILLELKLDDKEPAHQLTFNDVSSFYYVNSPDTKKIGMPKWDYSEVTSLVFIEDGEMIRIETSKTTSSKYYSLANFLIEIWSTMFFIEAQRFSIDGKVIYLG